MQLCEGKERTRKSKEDNEERGQGKVGNEDRQEKGGLIRNREDDLN